MTDWKEIFETVPVGTSEASLDSFLHQCFCKKIETKIPKAKRFKIAQTAKINIILDYSCYGVSKDSSILRSVLANILKLNVLEVAVSCSALSVGSGILEPEWILGCYWYYCLNLPRRLHYYRIGC